MRCWRRLLTHCVLCARAFAREIAGSKRVARTPMMAITTIISISVNAFLSYLRMLALYQTQVTPQEIRANQVPNPLRQEVRDARHVTSQPRAAYDIAGMKTAKWLGIGLAAAVVLGGLTVVAAKAAGARQLGAGQGTFQQRFLARIGERLNLSDDQKAKIK